MDNKIYRIPCFPHNNIYVHTLYIQILHVIVQVWYLEKKPQPLNVDTHSVLVWNNVWKYDLISWHLIGMLDGNN